MSWLFCLIAVVSAVHGVTGATTCSWKEYPDTHIPGGVEESVASLRECQSVCQSKGCKGVNWNPASRRCWICYTQIGRKTYPGVVHYDYVCKADPCSPNPCLNGGKCSASSTSPGYICTCSSGFVGDKCQTAQCRKLDVIKNPNIGRCMKSNYKGHVSDLYSLSGANIKLGIPSFKISWPSHLRLLPVTKLDMNRWTNLDYIRIEHTRDDGRSYLSEPFKAYNYAPIGITTVREITVYLAPFDYRAAVSITGFNLYYCSKKTSTGCASHTSIFKTDGILRSMSSSPPSTMKIDIGGLTLSTVAELPYIEVDLKCLQGGPVVFSYVAFVTVTNIKNAHVKIWNNRTPVNVVNALGVVSETFNFNPTTATNVNGILFAPGIRGDVIRVSLVPDKNVNSEIYVTVRIETVIVRIC